jgi:putative intracellular protease/amidase
MVLSPKGNNYNDYASVRKGLEKRGVRLVIASSTLEDARMDANGQGLTAKVDVLLKDVHAADYDAVVFGGGGVLHEYTGEKPNALLVRGLFREMLAERKPVAGICAGPAVLAQAGVLEGVRATCHTSVSDVLKSKGAKLVQRPGKNGELVNEPVVSVDLSENRTGSGYVVTGNGAGAAEPFCDALVHIIRRKSDTARTP